MGYFKMTGTGGNTKAGRKDPRYIELFDWLRDMDYTVREARCIASEAVAEMDKDPNLTKEQAVRMVLQ